MCNLFLFLYGDSVQHTYGHRLARWRWLHVYLSQECWALSCQRTYLLWLWHEWVREKTGARWLLCWTQKVEYRGEECSCDHNICDPVANVKTLSFLWTCVAKEHAKGFPKGTILSRQNSIVWAFKKCRTYPFLKLELESRQEGPNCAEMKLGNCLGGNGKILWGNFHYVLVYLEESRAWAQNSLALLAKQTADKEQKNSRWLMNQMICPVADN